MQADMATGLAKEIHPAQDVIGQDSDDVEFCCRQLVATVTTQLFSYMVQKGVCYGYICTGEAFIFVYIPDDSSSVQCALCRPELDVKTIGEDELQLTVTAQAFVVEHKGEGPDQLQSREARHDVGKDGSPLDPLCPNYQDHQKGRIQIHGFCAGIRKQLAMDRGPDTDCRPLYKAGSCGALFKVRFSSHGYTVVAKGVEYKHVHKLKHEKQIYDELRDLQGECIPVCLGVIQLALKYPYYHDGGIYTHMLFLSWFELGGRSNPKS
ncbi:hypothetical protein GX48_05560 [Paracoccidioides brasiliensis]|nr:hypothetical protein GX48_05560 [Paracoccidioides brasiliensis]